MNAGHVDVKVVLVSAMASGQGKTTATAALARALVARGQRVRVFKCGPDFIDPMLLERASGAPVQTLDLWMVGLEQCRSLLAHAAATADAILIEGVMGLYDGAPSSADLANALGVPILAVIDASAMAQTAGALVLGLRDYGPVKLAGVIANRVAGPGHAAMVAASLRDIPLLASLPRQARSMPERHLGLVLPSEQAGLNELLDDLTSQLAFDDAAWALLPATPVALPAIAPSIETLLAGRTIAVARDAAFAFLYPANVATLRALGAAITWFSPLANEAIPAGCNALYLPGGYPELHGETLSQADVWTASVRAAHVGGMPILAECGGMMVLADSLAEPSGKIWPMAGILPGAITMQDRLSAIGPQGLATEHGELRGHTFHYSALHTGQIASAQTRRHPDGGAGESVYRVGSLTASYFHAYFPSCPAAVADMFTPHDSKMVTP